MQFPVLWSIFVSYIITHQGLGGFSELIIGLIVAAIGAFSMLMSKPRKKSNVEKTLLLPSHSSCYMTIRVQMQTKLMYAWIPN